MQNTRFYSLFSLSCYTVLLKAIKLFLELLNKNHMEKAYKESNKILKKSAEFVKIKLHIFIYFA